MYRVGLEHLLGFTRHGNSFSVSPCIPAAWPSFTLRWRSGRTRYTIRVVNPDGVASRVRSATFDGRTADHRALPVIDDGHDHLVEIVMGIPATMVSTSQLEQVAQGSD
jgi:cellobiose phosphorylase